VWIGIAPRIFFETIEKPVEYIVKKVDPQYYARQPLQHPVAEPAVHNEAAAGAAR
jgi:hypothetical protein